MPKSKKALTAASARPKTLKRRLTLGYQPTDWTFTTDEAGNRVYNDHRLNVLQANLKTMYDLVDDLRIQAFDDLHTIQSNLNAKTVHDPTVSIIGWLASKCVEVIALAFPAGTAAAVISGLTCRLISGAIQNLTKDSQSDPYNAIQSAVNDLRDAIDVLFSELEKQITDWQKYPQKYWATPYEYPRELDNIYKGPITLSHLADCDAYFPRKGYDDDYNQVRNLLFKQTRMVMTRQLLPVNYAIHWSPGQHDHGGFVTNKRWFWQVAWYETSSSNKWDEWRRHPEFPNIPNNLKDSIGGWWEDIDYYEDYKGGKQYYQPFDRQGDHDYGAPGHIWYWWTRMPGHRWMYWGGRHVPTWNAHDQGPGDDSKIKDGNIIQGTPFLDLIEDMLTTENYDWGYPHACTLIYYKLKDPKTKEVFINSRKVEHMTCVDYCNDWYYEYNTWRWNWAYRGIALHFAFLVDKSGNPAPDSLCKWLFRDDGHGKTINPKGIADRLDVFYNWKLETR
jgi:hypothetical protein